MSSGPHELHNPHSGLAHLAGVLTELLSPYSPSSPFADFKTLMVATTSNSEHHYHQPQLPARPSEDLPLSVVSACKHDQHPAHQLPPGLQLFSVQLQSSYTTLLGQLNSALGSSSGSVQYHGNGSTYYPPHLMNAPQ